MRIPCREAAWHLPRWLRQNYRYARRGQARSSYARDDDRIIHINCVVHDDLAAESRGLGQAEGQIEHAPADFLGARGVQFDMMNASVRAIDDQPNTLAHLVIAQPLVEHATGDSQ
jgi:hypothetical protein